jgi:hypothetical protein
MFGKDRKQQETTHRQQPHPRPDRRQAAVPHDGGRNWELTL